MKERALAVKLMVSAPWRTMKASKSAWMSTIIVLFDGAEYDVHVGGVDQCFQFKQFVPYLFLEDGLRSNGDPSQPMK
jgi:hypothetical protein